MATSLLLGNRNLLVRAFTAYVEESFFRALLNLKVAYITETIMYVREYRSQLYGIPFLPDDARPTAMPTQTEGLIFYALNKMTGSDAWYLQETVSNLLSYSTELYGGMP